MKRFQVGDRTVVVIDGELYERLLPLDAPSLELEAESSVPKKRGRKPQKAFNTRLSEIRERKHRNVLGPEAEETIRQEIAAGMGLTEVCKKYEISVSTYYRLKNESKAKPVRED